MIFLFKDGKKKAVTFSYDDGQIHDIRLAKILRDHGLKGTFNLNSGTLDDKDGGSFVNKNKLAEIYEGHEIALHGVEHKCPTAMTDPQLITELFQDKFNLEAITGKIVEGMAYAYGAYSSHVIDVARSLGIKYSRTVGENHNFDIPGDFLAWDSTCHHNNDLMKHGEEFLNCPDWKELPLMYVWGHSFEFAGNDSWQIIEEFAEYISGREEIWYATNGEICNYVTATKRLEFSADGSMVMNPTCYEIWYKGNNGMAESIKPGECKRI